jgi:carbonic anhydrase
MVRLLFLLVALPSAAGEPPQPSPDEALKRLKDGHARFMADKPAPRHTSMKELVKLAHEQHPFAVVLTCADSRVAPELVFDQGLGDLFTLRVAGNVTETGVVGSVEYAVQKLKCPLVVVLGHDDCGAVKAAMHLEETHGQLGALVEQVRIGKAPDAPTATRTNARHHAEEVTHKSQVLRDFVGAGRIRIVAAVYTPGTGAVTWLDRTEARGKK